MKFGLAMFGLSPRHYPDVAMAAEASGFESVWMPEHLVLPAEMPPTYLYTESGYPPISPETPMFDTWVVLGAVAQATTTIRLATNVYILPLRHPLITARAVVTLDRISNGRVTLGAGVGWLEEEFEAAGQNFADRGPRTDEIIGLLRSLWSDDTIDHHGRYYDIGPIKFEPKPRQKPTIPIEIGGSTPPALRRAGRLGDGWIEAGAKDEADLERMVGVIQEHRRAAGRDRQPFELGTSKAEGLASVRRLESMGFTRITVGPTPSRVMLGDPGGGHDALRKEDFEDFVKRYADEVISSY